MEQRYVNTIPRRHYIIERTNGGTEEEDIQENTADCAVPVVCLADGSIQESVFHSPSRHVWAVDNIGIAGEVIQLIP